MKGGCVFALLTCVITFFHAKFAMSFRRTACENQRDVPHFNKQL